MARDDNNEDDWEYEYSTTETETFFVDLDLSSVNNVIKSKIAGDRKSIKPLERNVTNDTGDQAQTHDKGKTSNDNQNSGDRSDTEGEADGTEETRDLRASQQPQSPQTGGLLGQDNAGRVQMLDFDTPNPIISYNGNYYSCTWHDMLGTTLFVTKHQEAPFHEPEISTEDYDMIGTSRIKLVGHRARVVPKVTSRKRRRDDEDDVPAAGDEVNILDRYVPEGRSLGTIKRTNPKTNIEIKRQANFLEQLMEVKKARGETDTVRTFVDRHTVAGDAKQARLAQRKAKEGDREVTEEQRLRQEIEELNRRVVKGDNEALERLQDIYANIEEIEDEDEDDDVMINKSRSAAVISRPVAVEHIDDSARNNAVEMRPSAASQPNAASSPSSPSDGVRQ